MHQAVLYKRGNVWQLHIHTVMVSFTISTGTQWGTILLHQVQVHNFKYKYTIYHQVQVHGYTCTAFLWKQVCTAFLWKWIPAYVCKIPYMYIRGWYEIE